MLIVVQAPVMSAKERKERIRQNQIREAEAAKAPEISSQFGMGEILI
jgi:hypothetical protein